MVTRYSGVMYTTQPTRAIYMSERANVRQGSGESKKDWILRLWGELREPTTREVADIVGCMPEYVRVVVRQRKGTGVSEHDNAYRARFKEKHGMAPEKHRYHKSPESRERMLTTNSEWRRRRYATDPAYRETRNVYKREWIKANWGTPTAYKRFLTERKAAKAGKERV